MVYNDIKDSPRRTAFDKILLDNTFNNAKSLKFDGYQEGLASMVYTFFDKKSVTRADKSAKNGATENKTTLKQLLAEELHQLIIRKFRKRKVYSSFKDNIGSLSNCSEIRIHNHLVRKPTLNHLSKLA